MNTFLTQLTQPRTRYPDPVERQQAQRLLVTNLAWGGLMLLFTPLVLWWAVQNQAIDAGTLYTPVALLLAINVHHQIHVGQIKRARWLFVINSAIAALLANFPEYRIDTPFVFTMAVPLTAAAVLLPRSGMFTVAITVLGIFSVGGLLQLNADMQPTPLGSGSESIGVTLFLVIGISLVNVLLLWIFSGTTDDAVRLRRSVSSLLNTTTQLSQTLVQLPTSSEELGRAVEQLRDALGLYHVQVFVADPTSGLAVLQAGTGFIGRKLLEEDRLQVLDEKSLVNDVLRQKDPVVVLDTDSEARRAGFLPATRSELLLPLRVGNLVPIGVLDLHSTDRGAFSEDVRNLLVTISNHLAAALYGAQQSRDVRTSYEERDRLVEQLDTYRRDLARLNRQLISATWGTFLSERQDAPPAYEWRTGGVQPVHDPRTSLALEDEQPHLEKGEDSDILSVPIRLRGQTIGALEFRRAGNNHWSSAALEMAQAVSDRLALALENARLFEQAQLTAQREQLVSQVTAQLQTTNDLQALLTVAAAQFQEALGAVHTRVRLGLPEQNAPSQAE